MYKGQEIEGLSEDSGGVALVDPSADFCPLPGFFFEELRWVDTQRQLELARGCYCGGGDP